MQTVKRAGVAAIGSIMLIGTAAAADLTGPELKTLLSGKSTYLENTATSRGGVGQGVIYYAADGASMYKTAKGDVYHGQWTIKGNTVCNTWKEVPPSPCSRYTKEGDTITVINADTGQVRAKVIKIADGNPEKIS
jgi:hypothetical protein